MKTKPTTTKPRRVTWEDWDQKILLLGSMGLSTKAIVRQVGCTPCQATYRLHKAAVRRADYRNGENWASRWMLGQITGSKIRSEVRSELRKRGLI